MADMKIPRPTLPATVARPMSGARAEAIRSAQKAFFQAATTETQASARPEQKPAKARPAAPAVAPVTEGQPQRYLRPGSRLDIKV